MDTKRHIRLFDWIAPVYSWFFTYQVGQFQQMIAENPDIVPPAPSRILDIGCGTGALVFVLSEQDHEVTGLDASRRMIAIARRLNRGNQAVFIQGNALEWPNIQHGEPAEWQQAHGISATTREARSVHAARADQNRSSRQSADARSFNKSPANARTATDATGHGDSDDGVTVAWAEVAGPFDVVMASFVLHGLKQKQRRQLYAIMNQLACQRVIVMDYNQRRNPLISLMEWFERGDYFQFIYSVVTELREVFPQVKVIQTGPHSAWYVCDQLADVASLADDSD